MNILYYSKIYLRFQWVIKKAPWFIKKEEHTYCIAETHLIEKFHMIWTITINYGNMLYKHNNTIDIMSKNSAYIMS